MTQRSFLERKLHEEGVLRDAAQGADRACVPLTRSALAAHRAHTERVRAARAATALGSMAP